MGGTEVRLLAYSLCSAGQAAARVQAGFVVCENESYLGCGCFVAQDKSSNKNAIKIAIKLNTLYRYVCNVCNDEPPRL